MGNQGVYLPLLRCKGISPFIWGLSFWDTFSVVSQWIPFPTALNKIHPEGFVYPPRQSLGSPFCCITEVDSISIPEPDSPPQGSERFFGAKEGISRASGLRAGGVHEPRLGRRLHLLSPLWRAGPTPGGRRRARAGVNVGGPVGRSKQVVRWFHVGCP